MNQDDEARGEESSDVSNIETNDQNPNRAEEPDQNPNPVEEEVNYVLPPMAPADVETNKKTLVLDLDETLIRATFRAPKKFDFVVRFMNEGQMRTCYVLQRPGVDYLLQELSEMFEIVVFTASNDSYANAVLDELDPRRFIQHRLTRNHCVELADHIYVKDLSKLGRDYKKLVFVDDRPFNCYQSQNAYPIAAFTGDEDDVALLGVVDFCKRVAASTSDVRDELKRLSYTTSAGANGLLPRVEMSDKKTLVFYLDGVIVRSTTNRPANYDFTVDVYYMCWKRTHYILKRPGLDTLLSELAERFEIVVFFKADENYWNAVLDKIDPSQTMIPPSHRLLKMPNDLSLLGRELRKVICVDVAPFHCHQTPNVYPVFEFQDDVDDRTLFHLSAFCTRVADSTSDVRAELLFYFRPLAASPSANWVEYTSRSAGDKYYYNKVTKETTWQKPLEMMSQEENAAMWIECTSHDGRKYYHNKITKKSQWNVPPRNAESAPGFGLGSTIDVLVHVDDADKDAREALECHVLNTLVEKDFRVTSSSTLDDFKAALDGCDELGMLADAELKLLFDNMVDFHNGERKEIEGLPAKRRHNEDDDSHKDACDKRQKVDE